MRSRNLTLKALPQEEAAFIADVLVKASQASGQEHERLGCSLRHAAHSIRNPKSTIRNQPIPGPRSYPLSLDSPPGQGYPCRNIRGMGDTHRADAFALGLRGQ